MRRILIVEDQAKDIETAATVAESLGIGDIEACKTVHKARISLERGISGEGPLPDAIVLDLDLGLESGYELLRFWRSTPELFGIPLMIWSVVEEQREICELFRVKSFVSKWEGVDAFRQALAELIPASPTT